MCIIAISEMAVAFNPVLVESRYHSREKGLELLAIPPHSGGGSAWGQQRRAPSRTARESAVTVEWEPRSELERRIEHGVNYEHFDHQTRQVQNGGSDTASSKNPGPPPVRGVFCGYRCTAEDYGRLKSANL